MDTPINAFSEVIASRLHLPLTYDGSIVGGNEAESNPANALSRVVEFDQSDELAVRDLAAQEMMADVAILMAVIALLTVVVTIVGTLLIAWQVKLTRRAVEDTALATDSMRHANEIAEDTSKRQLRAYVATEDHSIIDFVVGQQAGFVCKVYNRGQTPAYDVQIWSQPTAIKCDQETPDFAKIRQNGKFAKSKALLGPGQFIVHENRMTGQLEESSYYSVSAGGIAIIWAGVVTYRDSFGKRRISSFKYMATGEGAEMPSSFDMHACGRGNRAN